MASSQTRSGPVHRLRRRSAADRLDHGVVDPVGQQDRPTVGAGEVDPVVVGQVGRQTGDRAGRITGGRVESSGQRQCATLGEPAQNQRFARQSGLGEERGARGGDRVDRRGECGGVGPVLVDLVPDRVGADGESGLDDHGGPASERIEPRGLVEERLGAIAVPGQEHEQPFRAIGAPSDAAQRVGHRTLPAATVAPVHQPTGS
jgi:hypothetical protein